MKRQEGWSMAVLRKAKAKKGGVENEARKGSDRALAIPPDQLGPGWISIVPERVSIADDLRPIYRELKGYSLEEFDERRAQLLTIIFQFKDNQEAVQAFQMVGEGLETDLPKRPAIGDESVIYDLDMRPMVVMKIFSTRKDDWVTIFTLWLFKDFDLDDSWVAGVMTSQLKRLH
jgi:hypothetical protein